MHNTRHEVWWKLHIQDSQSMLHYPSIKILIYYMAANATEQVTYLAIWLICQAMVPYKRKIALARK